MKHTKGPWKVSKTDNAIRRMTGAKTPSEIEANAILMATAPELLEELKSALKLLESIQKETGYTTTVTQLAYKKLIAKAEGES